MGKHESEAIVIGNKVFNLAGEYGGMVYYEVKDEKNQARYAFVSTFKRNNQRAFGVIQHGGGNQLEISFFNPYASVETDAEPKIEDFQIIELPSNTKIA